MTILKKVFRRKKTRKPKNDHRRYLDPSGTAINAWRTL